MARFDDIQGELDTLLTPRRNGGAGNGGRAQRREAAGGILMDDVPEMDAESAGRPNLSLAPKEAFSPFQPDHMSLVAELVTRFSELAQRKPGKSGLRAVMREAGEAKAREGSALVDHALMIFITHNPQAAAAELSIPSFEERRFDVVRATQRLTANLNGTTSAGGNGPSTDEGEAELDILIGVRPVLDPEPAMSWFRADIMLNDHHDHWHRVYPTSGVNGALKDRQGELFIYMHQQMLARYDTERIAVGLPRVRPLSNYREKLYGFDAGGFQVFEDDDTTDPTRTYSGRPPGLSMADARIVAPRVANRRLENAPYGVADHEARRDRVLQAVRDGAITGPGGASMPLDVNLLCCVAEANFGSPNLEEYVDARGNIRRIVSAHSFYGQLHNYGHVLIADLNERTGNGGVMSDPATALLDPVFYRWHKQIDDVACAWQERQEPNDFSDAPPVLIRNVLSGAERGVRSPDIILCLKSQVAGANDPAFDWERFGVSRFGGANWDKDFSAGDADGAATSELVTRWHKRVPKGSDGQPLGLGEPVTYLDQDEFVYFIRVENRHGSAKRVTARIFLAAERHATDRRMWIEMDKFIVELAGGQKRVIVRDAAFSSVIRRPAQKPPNPAAARANGQARDDYCACGWPFNLLLPRGTETGMPFRLMVMLTDAEKDKVEEPDECGSMSYCGKRDRKYPDTRPMGYPFDRPFLGRTLARTILEETNMASRSLTVRWFNDLDVPVE